MNIEIPEELLLPTNEELENRTINDLKKKWKPSKRLGKKERKEAKAAVVSTKSLSSLFVKNEKPKVSPSKAKPTLRIFLENKKQTETGNSLPHKRGRPPKMKRV